MSVHHRSTDSNIKSSHGNDISPRKRHIKLSNWSQLNASWFASTCIKSSWYYITTFVLVVEENSKWYKKVSECDYGAKFASSRLEDWDPTEIFAHSCKRFTNSLSRGETSGRGWRQTFLFISFMTGLGLTLKLWHSSTGTLLQTFFVSSPPVKYFLDILTRWSLSAESFAMYLFDPLCDEVRSLMKGFLRDVEDLPPLDLEWQTRLGVYWQTLLGTISLTICILK